MGAESAQDLTLAGLAHDLNNVFGAILEAAELLEQDPQWRSVAGAIRRSAEHGRHIAASLMATVQGAQLLEPILTGAMEFTQDLLKTVHAPPVVFAPRIEEGIAVPGPTAAWERVLLNLFLNAAQTIPQSVRIEVSARRTAAGVEISIADNGPGIPPAILPHIFEPHFSTKSGGGGMGLHIVKSLVEECGGSVSAANRPGGGAVFSIRLAHA